MGWASWASWAAPQPPRISFLNDVNNPTFQKRNAGVRILYIFRSMAISFLAQKRVRIWAKNNHVFRMRACLYVTECVTMRHSCTPRYKLFVVNFPDFTITMLFLSMPMSYLSLIISIGYSTTVWYSVTHAVEKIFFGILCVSLTHGMYRASWARAGPGSGSSPPLAILWSHCSCIVAPRGRLFPFLWYARGMPMIQ